MKIDLPALNYTTNSVVDYNRVYPKNYEGQVLWPEPINWWDTNFIEVNTPKKILMSNIVKPISNALKKLNPSVDLSVTGKSKIFKNFTTIPTNKLNVEYSPLSMSTGLRHFIACNRPYWSRWELVREPVDLQHYNGYYKFSSNQIAFNSLLDLSGNGIKTWDDLNIPNYDKLNYFINREFWSIGNIYGFGRETRKITYRTTQDNKITMLMLLGAPCSTFYGVPATGSIDGEYRVASYKLFKALNDQNKFTDLDNFLTQLSEKLFDRIESVDILIDPNNLGDLAMSFSSYGLTFTIQGYKSWPVGCGYSYSYISDTPNFGSPNQAFEIRISGIAQVIDNVFNNTTYQYEPVYKPINVDILTYLATCFYIEDL